MPLLYPVSTCKNQVSLHVAPQAAPVAPGPRKRVPAKFNGAKAQERSQPRSYSYSMFLCFLCSSTKNLCIYIYVCYSIYIHIYLFLFTITTLQQNPTSLHVRCQIASGGTGAAPGVAGGRGDSRRVGAFLAVPGDGAFPAKTIKSKGLNRQSTGYVAKFRRCR